MTRYSAPFGIALVAALTGAEPVATIGRGSGIDDEAWMRKAAAIRDALRRARPHARDPLALLRVAAHEASQDERADGASAPGPIPSWRLFQMCDPVR